RGLRVRRAVPGDPREASLLSSAVRTVLELPPCIRARDGRRRRAQGPRPEEREVRGDYDQRLPHGSDGREREDPEAAPPRRGPQDPVHGDCEGRREGDRGGGRAGLLDVRRDRDERRDGPVQEGRDDRDPAAGAREGPPRVRGAVPRAQLPGRRVRRDAEPRDRGRVQDAAPVLPPWLARRLPPRDEVPDPPGARPRDRGDGPVSPPRHRVRGHDHDDREHHGRGMRPLRALVSLDDALRMLDALATPIERTERVPLLEALHRVASRNVVAGIDVPLADRAAMDGYAVRASDTYRAGKFKPAELRRIETLS